MIKGSGKHKITIKQEVFNVGFIFSMVTLLLFGSVLCVSIYFLEVNNSKDTLQGLNYHMAVVVKNGSKSISSTLKVLSNDLDIREAGFADNIELTDEVKKLYRDYYNADNSITHIYSAYENGKIIIMYVLFAVIIVVERVVDLVPERRIISPIVEPCLCCHQNIPGKIPFRAVVFAEH